MFEEKNSEPPDIDVRGKRRKYKLSPNKIGEGAYGNVFLAYDVMNNEEIIAKKICVKKFLEMYKVEVKILKQLEGHPNIVKILGHKIIGSNGFIFFGEN